MLFKRISFIVLIALLLSSPAARASAICNQLFSAQSAHEQAVRNAHDAITADLYNGRIVSIRPFSENDNKNQLFLTTIEARDPYTGQLRYREAFYKPAIWGDGDGWARTAMEYVAYALNRVLGMDYVPPTAYRRHMPVDVNGHHWEFGVLIHRAPEYTPLLKLPYGQFNHGEANYHDAVESDHRVLAVLLQNADGHGKNIGQGRHWVDGATRPIFIDWNASLRHGADVGMTEYHAHGNTRPVTRVREQTLAALRRLDPTDFQPWIQDSFVSEAEARRILETRDEIVRYFDGLIAGKGEDAVLIRF